MPIKEQAAHHAAAHEHIKIWWPEFGTPQISGYRQYKVL